MGTLEQYLDQRLCELDAAEKLALADKNLKNFNENMTMVTRCIAGKSELWDLKLALQGGRLS